MIILIWDYFYILQEVKTVKMNNNLIIHKGLYF